MSPRPASLSRSHNGPIAAHVSSRGSSRSPSDSSRISTPRRAAAMPASPSPVHDQRHALAIAAKKRRAPGVLGLGERHGTLGRGRFIARVSPA